MKKKPLKFIPDSFIARISHRKLSAFEERNPNFVRPAFDTWQEANTYQMVIGRERVERAEKEFRRAQRFLARVCAMKEPQS